MHISSCLWSSHAVPAGSAEVNFAEPEGAWPAANHRQHKVDKSKKREEPPQQHPFRGATAPKVNLYASAAILSMDTWLAEIQRREPVKPNAKQFAIVAIVARRIKYEMLQEQAPVPGPRADDEEPMLDLIHGLPGTGKSEVIVWLKELFHLIGWQHGVQYVCLAVQNSMAASIAPWPWWTRAAFSASCFRMRT